MLGSLLRASSYTNMASMTDAGATAKSLLGSSGGGGSSGSAGLFGEETALGSVPFSLLSAPLILDHVPDDLKYKLFASKSVPFSSSGSLPQPPNSFTFRILIAEETGRMCRNNYNVVMDDYSTTRGPQMEQIRPNELKEYIFGSPIRSADLSQGDKFRNIPNSGLVMITRVFYCRRQMNKNRLAVSLCVPAVLLPAIPEAWTAITRWLDQCQNIVLTTLDRSKAAKGKSSGDGILPSNLNVHFPKECDNIVQLLQQKLIPCLRSMMEIPRLFLYPQNYHRFVKVWFRDIFSWIEIKDGPRVNFLPALLGKIICDFKDSLHTSETTRIVVISGNMVVANKLLFIISALLEPRYRGKIEFSTGVDSSEYLPQHKYQNSKRDSLKKWHGGACDLSKYTTTKKGWEIPRISSREKVVSLSSSEQLAEVIQPSSLKSASSSLHYLSSSLSSHNGSSYGSWFNKLTSQQTSPTFKNSDHWDKISPGHTGTLGGAYIAPPAAGRGSGLTPQPSPSISEYEEFPWTGTPSSPRCEHFPNTHSSSRQLLNSSPLGEVRIKRDCQRIDQSDLLDEAFFKICKPGFELSEGEYEIVPGDSRHAAFMQIDIDSKTMRQEKPSELLPRYTYYLPKLNHWFKLQGFPVGPESESRVIYTMRKDLQVSNCSRSLLVSLRSREIKEITIMKNDQNKKGENRHGIVQKTKKIFNNGKCGNISSRLVNCIAFVDASIRKAMAIYEDADILQEQTDQETLEVFESILHYTSKC